MKKVKVLHITSTRYGIGGVEKLLLDMSGKYDTERFDISYCNLFCDADGKGVFPVELRKRGLKVFEVKGKRWAEVPQMVFRVVRLLRSEKFDIVHLHMLKATIVGGLASQFYRGTKVVLTKHYTDILSKHSAAIKKLDNHFTKSANKIVAISEYVKADMVNLSIPTEKIVVIYKRTDNSAFDPLAKESWPNPDVRKEAAFLIGTVGSLTARKGHKYLFEAISIVAERYGEIRLIVIGEGPEKQRLTDISKELGLGDRLTMAGFQENVAPLLKSLDLYVHPSIHEPFGIAILEAMTAGKCVIGTNVDGVPEIVLDGRTGILVNPASSSEIANAICRLMEDPSLLQRLGTQGREVVKERFMIENTVRGYENIWQNVMEI
jgi:glycosyltransferase involved in cell wall biosynthesis